MQWVEKEEVERVRLEYNWNVFPAHMCTCILCIQISGIFGTNLLRSAEINCFSGKSQEFGVSWTVGFKLVCL